MCHFLLKIIIYKRLISTFYKVFIKTGPISDHSYEDCRMYLFPWRKTEFAMFAKHLVMFCFTWRPLSWAARLTATALTSWERMWPWSSRGTAGEAWRSTRTGGRRTKSGECVNVWVIEMCRKGRLFSLQFLWRAKPGAPGAVRGEKEVHQVN